MGDSVEARRHSAMSRVSEYAASFYVNIRTGWVIHTQICTLPPCPLCWETVKVRHNVNITSCRSWKIYAKKITGDNLFTSSTQLSGRTRGSCSCTRSPSRRWPHSTPTCKLECSVSQALFSSPSKAGFLSWHCSSLSGFSYSKLPRRPSYL